MANEMRVEFENYIQQLTETICKEIYLKDLQELCQKYREQLDDCKELYQEHTKLEQDGVAQTKANLERLDEIKVLLDENLGQIHTNLQNFETEYDAILAKYSLEVNKVNEDLRDAFFKDFSNIAEEVKSKLLADMSSSRTELEDSMQSVTQTMKEALSGVITAENLDTYVAKMDESTSKIEQGLSMLNDGYQEVFVGYSKKLDAYQQEQLEKYRTMAESYVREGMDRVSERFDILAKEQTSAIEEKLPDKNEIVQVEKEISQMCEKIEKMQISYEKKLSRLVRILERNEKVRAREDVERRQDRREIYYLEISNTIMLIMLCLLGFMMKPWEEKPYGMVLTVVAGGVVFAYVVLSVIYKKKRSKQNREARQAVNNSEKKGHTESEKGADGR